MVKAFVSAILHGPVKDVITTWRLLADLPAFRGKPEMTSLVLKVSAQKRCYVASSLALQMWASRPNTAVLAPSALLF